MRSWGVPIGVEKEVAEFLDLKYRLYIREKGRRALCGIKMPVLRYQSYVPIQCVASLRQACHTIL